MSFLPARLRGTAARLRLPWQIWVRLALIATFFAVLPLAEVSVGRKIATAGLGVGVVIYTFALRRITRGPDAPPGQWRYVNAIADASATTISVWLTGGFTSPFYPAFFLAIMGIARRYGTRLTVISSVLMAGGYAAMSVPNVQATSAWSEFATRLVFLVAGGVLAGVLAWFVESLQAARQQLARHAEVVTRAEARTRRLFDDAPVMYVVVQASDGRTRITDWNAMFADVLGLGPAELRGRPIVDLYDADTRQALVDIWADPVANRWVGERNLVASDGHVLTTIMRKSPATDASGAPADILMAFVDITDRKEVDAALRASEERFGLVVGATSDGILDIDLQSGEIYRSERLRSLLGGPGGGIDELVAKGAQARLPTMHPEDRAAFLDAYLAALRGDRNLSDVRFRLKIDSGDYIWLELQGVVVRNEAGEPTRLVASLKDVSRERELEDRLMRTHRLTAVGELSGGIAHSFGNLLTVMRFHAELAAEHVADDGPVRRALRAIDEAAEQGADTLKGLLAFSRRQALAPEVIDVNAVVHHTVRTVRPVLPDDIRMLTRLAPGLPPLLADHGQLSQALINLMLNARDAMPDGGTLSVETSALDVDATFGDLYADLRVGPYTVVSISDGGAGIAAEVRDRIFEPFVTTKDDRAGMGLASALGFAQQSGGTITPISGEGLGTTFKLLLPATASTVEADAELPARRPKAAAGRTILLVDNNDPLRTAVAAALASGGYTVLEAADGRQGLEVAHGQADAIDLVVSDYAMPGLDGLTLARELAQGPQPIPTLLTSAYTRGTIDEHAGDVDSYAEFLEKPFSAADLLEAVQRTIELASPAPGGADLDSSRAG